MGFLRNQFRKVIQWENVESDLIVYKYPLEKKVEIMKHSKLVVREGQRAVFINQGKLADVFEPGTYDLDDVKVSGIFQRKFLKQFEDVKTEEEILSDIYNYIDELPEDIGIHMSTRILIQFVNSNCYDTIYKRYRPELTEYLRWKVMKR